MQERHQDRERYYEEQAETTRKYVIPYLEEVMQIDSSIRVLEIGCGEGGNLLPFAELGCEVVGVDLSEVQIQRAREYTEERVPGARAEFIYRDIYKLAPEDIGSFDLIMMRDVIEHIHDQEKFMHFVKQFLSEQGKFYLGFPPWYMPFGGHQQVMSSKLGSRLPYFHILPKPVYRGMLKAMGAEQVTIEALEEIKDTGISIERFLRIVRREDYHIDRLDYYLINPNYEIKFGLRPRRLWWPLSKLPFIRNFYTTCIYCILSKNNDHV